MSSGLANSVASWQPTNDLEEIVLRCMGGFGANDLERLRGCFQDDYTRHVTPGLTPVRSFAEHVADLSRRHGALADARFEVHDLFTDGDVVVASFSFVGRHVGEFHGIAPTGRWIRRPQICFFHFRDRRIAENFSFSDLHGMLRDLGAGAQAAPDRAGFTPRATNRSSTSSPSAAPRLPGLLEGVISSGDGSALRQLLSPGFEADGFCAQGRTLDAEGFLKHLSSYRASFDDLGVQVNELRASGSAVAVRFTVTGTQTDTFLDLPPRGRRLEQQTAAIFYFDRDRVSFARGVVDAYGARIQLG